MPPRFWLGDGCNWHHPRWQEAVVSRSREGIHLRDSSDGRPFSSARVHYVQATHGLHPSGALLAHGIPAGPPGGPPHGYTHPGQPMSSGLLAGGLAHRPPHIAAIASCFFLASSASSFPCSTFAALISGSADCLRCAAPVVETGSDASGSRSSRRGTKHDAGITASTSSACGRQ